MKTSTSERLTRVIFGLGLITVGSFSNIYVTALAYLMGLLLVGIGIYTKATEYPEDTLFLDVDPELKKAPAEAPRKAVRKKKPSRK